MDPSSLIFVVIVAIWAVYLLSHWVRRRDQVATARSVDRFSDAMRVLERRPVVRAVPLSRPNPRSYVVAPVAPAPPQVRVQRARPASAPGQPDAEEPAAASTRPASTPRRAPSTGPGRPAGRPAVRVTARRVAGRAGRKAAGQPRPLLGLILLALLLATPISWLLVATAAVRWWAGAIVTAVLVGLFVGLRRSAQRRRELTRRRDRHQQRSQSQSRRQSRRRVVGDVVAAQRGRAGQAGEAPAVPQVAAEAEVVAAAEPQPVVADGQWQPVPVPPPTYTLKPKASPRLRPPVPQPETASEPVREPVSVPAASSAAASVPGPRTPASAAVPSAPVDVSTDTGSFDLDEILQRRIAAGS